MRKNRFKFRYIIIILLLSAGMSLGWHYFNGDFGFYILIYSLIGFANGTLNKSFFENSISLPMILSFVNGLAYNFYIYFTHFLIRRKFAIPYYVFNVMVPNILFTLIATVLIYKLLYKLNLIHRN